MKSDYEIGLVPPLAYFASGGNYPIIRMMKSEWLPLPDPCSHICLCPNRIDSFETINFIFGVDAGVISGANGSGEQRELAKNDLK